MESKPPGDDRRSGSRQRTLLSGHICYGPQAAVSFACAIRNFTPQGALLEVPAEQVLPATFALIHVAGGVAFDARLTWRKGARAGALFLARHDLRQAETPEHRQLRRIWLALAPD